MMTAIRIFIISVGFLAMTLTGNAQTKQVGPFSKVHVSGNLKVELIHSTTPKVEYTILEGDPDQFVVEVFGEELEIKFKNTRFWEYFTSTKAKVKVYYTSLSRIDCAAGSSLVSVGTIEASSMDVEVSSGAHCELSLHCQEARVDISSGAEVILSGKAKRFIFDASSGAELDGFDFPVMYASGDASSGAVVKVHCTDTLDADVSSGGTVRYRGNPCSVKKHTSSGGEVRAL
jgi:hypothetical protein